MDWIRDGSGLHREDLDLVFKYKPESATVLSMRRDSDAVQLQIECQEEWEEWIDRSCPSPKKSESGLVVLFARRPSKSSTSKPERMSEKNLTGVTVEVLTRQSSRQSLESPKIKTHGQDDENKGGSFPGGGHGLMTVPFSRNTFEKVSRAFYMHSSISRVVSRADIPVFSHTKAIMEDEHGLKHEASVFNLRTSNAWAMDLALTVTYFPRCNLKFAVLFGCDLTVEEEIVDRLRLAGNDASHPLLLPGIVVEIERRRHVQIVDDIVDEVEARIFQLEVKPDAQEDTTTLQIEKLHRDKRSAWLNITYIRNCLVSWQKQLGNITLHVEELNGSPPAGYGWSVNSTTPISHALEEGSPIVKEESPSGLTQCVSKDRAPYHEQLQDRYLAIGYKIKSRILAIIEEYGDKVRDCELRIDGMSMATQWAQGETSLEIAKATSRDSKHMRSIALVTMVFLPGTFFAGVFSMTFFDWSGNGDQPVVSEYIWVYILFAAFVTLMTLGLWYFYNIYRRQGPKPSISAV